MQTPTSTNGSKRRAYALAAAFLLVALLLGGLVSAVGPAQVTQKAAGAMHAEGSVPGSPSSLTSFPSPIRHVLVVYFENAARSTVQSKGPYEVSLENQYAYSSTYYGICHPSAPNYLAGISGQTLQCGSDGYKSYSANNLGNLANAAGVSWKAYAESMPSACDTTTGGNYAVKHNPFPYFSDLGSSCSANDLPFTSWNPNSTTQPSFIWVTPNMLDDGHNTNVSYLDAWLKVFLQGGSYKSSSDLHGWKGILNEPWFSSTVVVLTYDEGEGTTGSQGYSVPGVSNSYCSPTTKSVCGGIIYFAAVSPYTKGVGDVPGNASHYNLLSTVEWLLGLPCTGSGADCNAGFAPMKGLFNFASPAAWSVGGTVTNATGAKLAGATVYANSSSSHSSTTTGSNGAFSFSLGNGTYTLTATDAGYLPASASATVSGSNVSGISLVLSSSGGSAAKYAVKGSVTDLTSGSGLSGATVYANSSSTHATTKTGSNGGFSFSLANGTYTITATDAGYVPASTSATVSGSSVSGISLVLSSSGGTAKYTVKGFVTDLTNGSGLSGAKVYANSSSTHLTTKTGSTGMFSFSLTNGTYTLTATDAGYVPASTSATVSGSNVSGISLALSHNTSGPVVYAVGGSVTDLSNGSGLSGATVFANTTNVSVSATTDANGSYQLLLANGSYDLTAVAPGYTTLAQNLTVAGANISGYDFALSPLRNVTPPLTYSVTGTVLSNTSLDPVQGAAVYANATGTSALNLTGTNGGYQFQLANGTYTLTVVASGYSVRSTNVTVNGTSVSNFTLWLDSLPGSAYEVDGVVVDAASGQPVGNATIMFTNGTTTIACVTNASGGFLTSLPNGTYDVTVVAPGYQSNSFETTLKGPAPPDYVFSVAPAQPAPGPRVPALELSLLIAGAVAAVGGGGALLLVQQRRRKGRQGPPRSED